MAATLRPEIRPDPFRPAALSRIANGKGSGEFSGRRAFAKHILLPENTPDPGSERQPFTLAVALPSPQRGGTPQPGVAAQRRPRVICNNLFRTPKVVPQVLRVVCLTPLGSVRSWAGYPGCAEYRDPGLWCDTLTA
jgi:hypothetical protein